MVKVVTGLSVPMPMLRLSFITNPSNLIMDNNKYRFLHITLVTSLFTADLPLISQNLIIFTPTTSNISYVTTEITVTLF